MFRKMIVGAVIVIAALTLTVTYLPSFVADSIYKNVDDLTDGEMPATVTAFQSGPEVVSTLGGSGEGLNCSLPAWANILFDGSSDARGKRHLVLQRFRQACVFHDVCYRHGLATYGYNQDDCDRILQNAAFRLCRYIRNDDKGSKADRCQTDSKMVLAGVSFGGYNAYRGWDRSSYFEFDPDPSRSNGFVVSRVVDHPFKAIVPAKYGDEPDQVILTFENIRSNIQVTCITCTDKGPIGFTRNPSDVSAELQSLGVLLLPEALLERDPKLSETMPVWLPPRRRHAAPHLLVDAQGKDHLIWMSRNDPQNTITCIVLADAARLLTNTLPKRDFCSSDAKSSLTMVEVDMFATSPLPMEIPGAQDPIYATALSPQMTSDNDLSFCSRSASRDVDRLAKDDDQSRCITFPDERVKKGAAFGAFQDFAVVRPGQQLIFARDVEQRTDSALTALRQRVLGDTYSPAGALLVIDVKPPRDARGAVQAELKKIIRFDIDDRFDPMLPIARKVDDLRFLSLDAAGSSVRLRTIDFARDNPAVGHARLTMDGTDVDLDRSWAERPMLVMETRDARPKTRLVFSRGEVAVAKGEAPSATKDSLTLQTLVFERDATAPSDAPFVKSAGATCKIAYEFAANHTDWECYRAFDPDRTMRASPAARMLASQILVGRFAQGGGQAIAFPDVCLKSQPVVLVPEGNTFKPASNSAGWTSAPRFTRTIECAPLDATAIVSRPIAQDKPAG